MSQIPGMPYFPFPLGWPALSPEMANGFMALPRRSYDQLTENIADVEKTAKQHYDRWAACHRFAEGLGQRLLQHALIADFVAYSVTPVALADTQVWLMLTRSDRGPHMWHAYRPAFLPGCRQTLPQEGTLTLCLIAPTNQPKHVQAKLDQEQAPRVNINFDLQRPALFDTLTALHKM